MKWKQENLLHKPEVAIDSMEEFRILWLTTLQLFHAGQLYCLKKHLYQANIIGHLEIIGNRY
jgi:hypothetical protein